MRRIVTAVILLVTMNASSASAQLVPHKPYRVEAHLEIGPMGSYFVRGRPLPAGANAFTFGYDAIVRVLWHPDHRLAVGLLSGYQMIVTEQFTIPDSLSDGRVSASVTTIPVMIDESMQAFGIEAGLAMGGYIIHSHLDDQTVSDGTRFELGTIFHIGSHAFRFDKLAIGAEVLINYMPYRGILSFAPQLDLKYDLLTY
jgi:hypothetical protein